MNTNNRAIRNRQNAARSTGPRSASGKLRSRANAFKNGLSVQSAYTAGELAVIDELAVALAGPNATSVQIQAARQVAEAECELWRVDRHRAAIVHEAIGAEARLIAHFAKTQNLQLQVLSEDLQIARAFISVLPQLTKLGRYESQRWHRRRRALGHYFMAQRELGIERAASGKTKT